MVKGQIHSFETSGMVDGPGIRFVVFMQGCLMRCQFCHNPDTWDIHGGKEVTVFELIHEIKDYLPFMEASGGGVTISGGEPLLQIDFLIELFKELKNLGIHTTVDTSAGCYSDHHYFRKKFDELLKYTDLFLLDLKQIDIEQHKTLTGLPNTHILACARYLSKKRVPVWIRHVLVPGMTDSDYHLIRLSAFIKSLSNVKKIEVLPYHTMGIYKWEQLHLKYMLDGVEPPTDAVVENAKQILIEGKVPMSLFS